VKRTSLLNNQFKNSGELTNAFDSWISRDGSSLFVVQVGPRAEIKAKQFAVEAIDFIRSNGYPVFWNISQFAAQTDQISLNDMIASLVFQALKYNPAAICNHPDQVSIAKFQDRHTEAEWRCLLLQIFSQMSKCFIVVEAQDLYHAYRDNPGWTTEFLRLFQDLINQAVDTSRSLKILVMSYNTDGTNVETENRITSVMHPPVPVPPRLRRKLGGIRNHRQFNKLPRF
jgi:hypothetical protein